MKSRSNIITVIQKGKHRHFLSAVISVRHLLSFFQIYFIFDRRLSDNNISSFICEHFKQFSMGSTTVSDKSGRDGRITQTTLTHTHTHTQPIIRRRHLERRSDARIIYVLLFSLSLLLFKRARDFLFFCSHVRDNLKTNQIIHI